MGLNLADFVTGRSIAREDAVVAVVIIPAEGGYPDAVRSAASPPVYPHDRFVPISLPLHGAMNEHGYFKPNKQLALDILLQTAKVSSWEEFERQALNEKDVPFEFSNPNKKMADILGMRRTVVPGLALLHRSTFASLIALAGDRDVALEVENATAICRDAQRRFVETKEPKYWGLSEMRGAAGRDYTLSDGRLLTVPWLMTALENGAGTEMSPFAVDVIRLRNQKAYETDGYELRDTYSSICDFQRLASGLHVANRYWAPSAFTRFDNLKAIADLQIRDLAAAFSGVSERLGIGPDDVDQPDAGLQNIADKLRSVLEIVDAELALHNSARLKP